MKTTEANDNVGAKLVNIILVLKLTICLTLLDKTKVVILNQIATNYFCY